MHGGSTTATTAPRTVVSRYCFGYKCEAGNPIRLSSFPRNPLPVSTLIRLLSETVGGINRILVLTETATSISIAYNGERDEPRISCVADPR